MVFIPSLTEAMVYTVFNPFGSSISSVFKKHWIRLLLLPKLTLH